MKCDNEQYIYFHTSTTSLSSYPVWLSINRPQIMSLGVRQATVTKFAEWRGDVVNIQLRVSYHPCGIISRSWITLVYVSRWRLVINCSPLLPRVLKICPQIIIVAASLEPVTIFQSCIIPVNLRRWSPHISSCSILVVLNQWIIRVLLPRCNSRVSRASLLWKSIQVFPRRWKCYRVIEELYPWCCCIRTL